MNKHTIIIGMILGVIIITGGIADKYIEMVGIGLLIELFFIANLKKLIEKERKQPNKKQEEDKNEGYY